MRITVVTPTIMRAALKQTVEALDGILREGDEHLVVRDACARTRDEHVLKELPMSRWVQYFECHWQGSRFGNAQRDVAFEMARGDCIVCLDDDDMPVKEAYDVLHELEPDPDTVHVFRMHRLDDNRMFMAEIQQHGSIGGPMCVYPKRPDLPLWMKHNRYESDWLVFEEVRDGMGLKIVCHPEIICRVSAQNIGR